MFVFVEEEMWGINVIERRQSELIFEYETSMAPKKRKHVKI